MARLCVVARFPYKNKRKRTDEEGKTGFDQEQQKFFYEFIQFRSMSHASTGRRWWRPGFGRLLYVNAFLYKNKRKRTDEEGKTGFEEKQQESFMNSFNLALCLTPRRVAGGGGPGLVRLCVVARLFTKTKGSGQTTRERQDLTRI